MALNANILQTSLFQALSPSGTMTDQEKASLMEYAGKISTAIVNHFIEYGEVTFAPGSINGACPGGSGGPLVTGSGNGGKIS